MVNHYWTKNGNEWVIQCKIKDKIFNPKIPSFELGGLCPYCNLNAKLEIENRKKEKQIKDRENQEKAKLERLERMKIENLQRKNTLTGYIK